MPTKKKYNARFPPARIKKIMQTDEDIGKVAAPVPVILSKALEIFMQSLLETACKNTQARHAKTMSTAHLKQCITSESQFDFLKELVENIPDLPTNEEEADDLDEPKPKRKRTSATVTRKENVPRKERKKKEKEVESESDEDSQSEEEEGSNSTESGSNTGIPSNTLSDASNSSSSFPKPMQTKRNDHFIPPKNLLEPSSSTSSPSLQIPNTSIPVPSLYRPVHSEDDDYDS